MKTSNVILFARMVFFIHHDLLVTFPSSPTFLIHWNLRVDFTFFLLENIETRPILN